MPPTSIPTDLPADATPDVTAADVTPAGGVSAAPARARRGEPDSVCAAAVDLAREAAAEAADGGTVGEHLGVRAEGERLVMHSFATTAKGYRGWRWAVTVARAPRSRTATVCEVVLLPGDDAVLPPTWVPWAERIAPGDIGAGDELAYKADDPLLEAGYEATGDEESDRFAIWELGLGRTRVLSREGRDDASRRWYRGKQGPTAEVAVQASASCASCGYLLQMSGTMRQLFGVCANEWSPSDGSVVSLDHGCGAHSETDVAAHEPEPAAEPILDETIVDRFELPPRGEQDDAPTGEVIVDVHGDGEVIAEEPADAGAEPAPVEVGPVAGEAPAGEGAAAEQAVADPVTAPVEPADPAEPVVAEPVVGDPVVAEAPEPAEAAAAQGEEPAGP